MEEDKEGQRAREKASAWLARMHQRVEKEDEREHAEVEVERERQLLMREFAAWVAVDGQMIADEAAVAAAARKQGQSD